jgi:hypothetical protein
MEKNNLVDDQKELVDELKTEWKKLWKEKFDDKIRAEGVAVNDYSMLYVDRGTIIQGTRDYKALDFKEILKQSQIKNVEKYIPPSPSIGGWNKFVKTQITNQSQNRKKRSEVYLAEKAEQKKQPKKSGRGWLHL